MISFSISNESVQNAYNEANAYLIRVSKNVQPEVQGRSCSFDRSFSLISNLFSVMPSVTVDNRTSYSSWGNNISMGNHQTTNVGTASTATEEENEKKKSKVNSAALTVGAGFFIAAAGAAGCMYKSYKKENENLEEKMALKESAEMDLAFLLQSPQEVTPAMAGKANKIISLTKVMINVQESQASRINNYARACLAAIVGAAALVVGSFAAESVLIPVGAILLIASVALALFTYTSHLDDE